MKYLSFIFLLLFGTTCTTYDNAIVYHKDFHSGTHPLLRFDGYYSDSIGVNTPANYIGNGFGVKPVFFYSNGSCFSTNNYTGTWNVAVLLATHQLQGSWGNYSINADTILLERFQLKENNYERLILRGIISKDQIHWIKRMEHNESYKPVDYSIFFKPFSAKPDSSGNFTRTKKKYNQ